MATLEVTIKKKNNRVVVEMDAERFERLAADFGFFSQDFLASLARAERDKKAGQLTKIKSLRDVQS
jgi:hypothetical protein